MCASVLCYTLIPRTQALTLVLIAEPSGLHLQTAFFVAHQLWKPWIVCCGQEYRLLTTRNYSKASTSAVSPSMRYSLWYLTLTLKVFSLQNCAPGCLLRATTPADMWPVPAHFLLPSHLLCPLLTPPGPVCPLTPLFGAGGISCLGQWIN
jgi:hypothetical protein